MLALIIRWTDTLESSKFLATGVSMNIAHLLFCPRAVPSCRGCAILRPLLVRGVSNFASQGGSVQKRIITFKMVELKTKTIINPNSCFSAILVSWFYVAGCMVLPELPYGSTLLTANLSLTSRPKLRMYATGLSFKITTKTHKQTHTHIMCVNAHVMLPPGSI